MAARAHSPFPVDPADVPSDLVHVIRRTLLRHAPVDPLDEDLARLLAAMVLAVLADGGRALDEAAGAVSQYTLATGAVMAIQAAR